MSKRVSYREESRKDWGATLADDERLDTEQIQLGALLRIADAVEPMAKHHVALQRDLDYYKRLASERAITIGYLSKSRAAIKGHLTRLKAKS
jgi:hypothetical protein